MAEVETLLSQLDPTVSVAEAAFDSACNDVVAIAVANSIHESITCVDG